MTDLRLGKWISVDDQLPDPYIEILATDGLFIDKGEFVLNNTSKRYEFYEHDWPDSPNLTDPTHWMLLPDLPEVPNE